MLEEEGTEVEAAEAVDSVEVVLVGEMTDADVTGTLTVSDPAVDSVTEVPSVARSEEVTMTEEAESVLLAIAVVFAALNPLVVEVTRVVVALSVDRLSVQELEDDEMRLKSSIAQVPPQVS